MSFAEDSQNTAPGDVPANKLGGARKGAEPGQNAAKRYATEHWGSTLYDGDV